MTLSQSTLAHALVVIAAHGSLTTLTDDELGATADALSDLIADLRDPLRAATWGMVLAGFLRDRLAAEAQARAAIAAAAAPDGPAVH